MAQLLELSPAKPRNRQDKPQAPGSGTCSNPLPPTYTDRPRLACIPLVSDAAFLAAAAAFLTSPLWPSTSTNGYSASTRVRSPGRAGVYFERASQLCCRAVAHFWGVSAPWGCPCKAWLRALRKMAYSAPEVPSMLFSTTGTMPERSARTSPESGVVAMCFRMAIVMAS